MLVPNSFKAAVLEEAGKPLRIIENIKIPKLEKGQVLVKIAYSGVCHSQLMEVRGLRGPDRWTPHLLGHEGTGTVVRIGKGVSKVKVGQKVVLGWIKGSGLDSGGTVFIGPNNEKINAGAVTTFSDYSIVSENRVVHLPIGTPLKYGVLYGCALPTGAGIVLNSIKPKKNNSLLVFGLGGIGLSALMAAKALGLEDIIAVDIEEDKLELAATLGAKAVINAKNQNVYQEIMKLTNNSGVDFAIEASGIAKSIEIAFSLIKRSGRCIFASHPKHGDKVCIDPFELISGKSLEGSWGGDSKPDRDIEILGSFYRKGMFELDKIISKPYSLEQINIALNDLEARKITRALIEIDPEQE